MSDTVDDWRAQRAFMKEQRRLFGVNCPKCAARLPKACPPILLPAQRCRSCGYLDPRPVEVMNDGGV